VSRRRTDARLAIDAAITATELAVASPQVIAARLAMGAAAMTKPSTSANEEAVLMVAEKAQALAEAGLAASRPAAEMTTRTAAFLFNEASSLDASPTAAAGRLYDYWAGMARLSLQMHAAAVAPIHKVAVANAKRLKS
jgi:hypothetical protein